MARKNGSFYIKEETLLVAPLANGDELRLMIGTRDDGKEYIDLRTWYRDRLTGELKPGKGFGKPKSNFWKEVGRILLNEDLMDSLRNKGETQIFSVIEDKIIRTDKM